MRKGPPAGVPAMGIRTQLPAPPTPKTARARNFEATREALKSADLNQPQPPPPNAGKVG